ncbi:hypothetical protein CAL26_00920 [Bordetella genomosp. 9]|uniref:Uncharacterized protein n=1 Tax=Bordetella genomosp. 9 TaxID=1416803 RepID=A0A261RM23_9BORD|nr:hypothetical protein [Bordetella genomosp. 9]OZI25951.1 hypothetical protein CAL26_00920 [Bordetella genomosp. 9]
MTVITPARFAGACASHTFADHATNAQGPRCDRGTADVAQVGHVGHVAHVDMATAFADVPGPRRKRGAADDSDIQFDCVDATNTENEPATVVQRIPV